MTPRDPTRPAKATPALVIARRVIVLALANGPRPGSDLCDTLAVRVGNKGLVTQGITWLHSNGLIVAHSRRGPWVTWKLTEAGVARAGELLQARAA